MALTLVELDTGPMAHLDSRMQTAVAHRRLRQDILLGRWQAGETLDEARLAFLYGVEAASVGRALKLLDDEGLVRSVLGGTVLTSLRLRDVRNVYEVRATLEPFAAALAAERVSRVHAGALRRLALAPIDSSTTELVERDQQLVQVIGEAAGNPQLANLLGQHAEAGERVLYLAFRDRVADDYSKLVDAIVGGFPDVAAVILRAHIAESRERAVNSLLREA